MNKGTDYEYMKSCVQAALNTHKNYNIYTVTPSKNEVDTNTNSNRIESSKTQVHTVSIVSHTSVI